MRLLPFGVLLVMVASGGAGPLPPNCYAYSAASLVETDPDALAAPHWFVGLPKDRPFVVRPVGYYIYCGEHPKLFIDDVRASRGLWLHHFEHDRIGWVPASKAVFKENPRDSKAHIR